MEQISKKHVDLLRKIIPKIGKTTILDVPFEDDRNRNIMVEHQENSSNQILITVAEEGLSDPTTVNRLEFGVRFGLNQLSARFTFYRESCDHLNKSGEYERQWIGTTEIHLKDPATGEFVDKESVSLVEYDFEDALLELEHVLDEVQRHTTKGQGEDPNRNP